MLRNRLIAVAAVVAAAALITGGTLAFAGSTGTRLDAKVLVTNPGPLPACAEDGSDCGLANTAHFYIRIDNANALTNLGARTRADNRNAFVVKSIDWAVFVNGVQDHDYDFTYTPPPNPSYQPYSGHWLVSASCPAAGPPCTDVGNPAVLPQEEASIFYNGWAHGNAEPSGNYIFKFTIHGILNGNAVDLAASSAPIRMTG
jgi:hypothetical protein